MEAKDTVMDFNQIQGIIPEWEFTYEYVCFKWLLQAQVEISFKAGVREAVNFCQANQMPDIHEAEPSRGFMLISKERWQAKLKEWGLSKEA